MKPGDRWRAWIRRAKFEFQLTGVVWVGLRFRDEAEASLAANILKRSGVDVEQAEEYLSVEREVWRGTHLDAARDTAQGWISILERRGIRPREVHCNPELQASGDPSAWHQLVLKEPSPRLGTRVDKRVAATLKNRPIEWMSSAQALAKAVPEGTAYRGLGLWSVLPGRWRLAIVAGGLAYVAGLVAIGQLTATLLAVAVVVLLAPELAALRHWIRDFLTRETQRRPILKLARSLRALASLVGAKWARARAALIVPARVGRKLLIFLFPAATFEAGRMLGLVEPSPDTWEELWRLVVLITVYACLIGGTLFMIRILRLTRRIAVAARSLTFLLGAIGVGATIGDALNSRFSEGLGIRGLDFSLPPLRLLMAVPHETLRVFLVMFLLALVLIAVAWALPPRVAMLVAPLLLVVFLVPYLAQLLNGVEAVGAGIRENKLSNAKHLAAYACILNAASYEWLSEDLAYVTMESNGRTILVGPVRNSSPSLSHLPVQVMDQALVLRPAASRVAPQLECE